MDPRHLQELMAVEQHYWWHRAKRALVLDVLRRALAPPGRLVEGGVGAGGNLAAFARLGYQVSGLDIAPEAGLRVRWVSHWNAFTYPAAWVLRRLERRRGVSRGAAFPKVSPLLNRGLLALAAAERRLMRKVLIPVGLSLVGVLAR